VTRYGIDSLYLIPDRGRDLSLCLHIQTISEVYQVFYPIDTEEAFPDCAVVEG
jgi:hypothetical protein